MKTTQKEKLKQEQKAYQRVLLITKGLKILERKIAIYHFLGSAILLAVFAYTKFDILLLNSIIFFGIGITIVFRREEDIRIGGILTYPLLLYYSLSNLLVALHFFGMVMIGIPIGIFLLKRNYIGQMLFYTLALFIFPLTSISYYCFSLYFEPITLLGQLYIPGIVIYFLLPQTYLYNLVKLKKTKIIQDLFATSLLLFFGIILWSLILKFISL